MSDMRFISTAEQMMYYYSCQIKCKLETGKDDTEGLKTTCSGVFVDCTGYGGYDPVDPCNQTCIQETPGVDWGDTDVKFN